MMKIVLKRGFSWPGEKFDRDGKGGREALGMGYCSINMWDGSELKLAWSRETAHISKVISQYFYHLIIQINQLSMHVMFYVKTIS